MACDSENGLAVTLGVIQSVEKVDAARPGSRNTNAQSARKFRISAGGHCRGFFVAHLHETNVFPVAAKRFEDSVHTIPGEAENSIDTPFHETFNQQITGGFRHEFLSEFDSGSTSNASASDVAGSTLHGD